MPTQLEFKRATREICCCYCQTKCLLFLPCCYLLIVIFMCAGGWWRELGVTNNKLNTGCCILGNITRSYTHTVESRCGYSLTWPFNWATMLIPVYTHGREIELLIDVCLMLWTVWKNMQYRGALLTLSVGDHCTWKYSQIHSRDMLSLSCLNDNFVRTLLEQNDRKCFKRPRVETVLMGCSSVTVSEAFSRLTKEKKICEWAALLRIQLC